VNYVYVPKPNHRPNKLPQFDTEWPSLRLLPIEYPDYNSIDSIDSQNVIRFGLRNKLQTKREDGIDDLINWEIFTDWRLRPRAGQTTFADVYSDLVVKPRSWLTLESETRFDVSGKEFRLAYTTLSLQPNDRWSWGLGHYYLRDDLTSAAGSGNNLITSKIFFRFNENWGAGIGHHFEARDGQMEEQYYSLYRDFRSWTGALTFRVRGNRIGDNDYAVAFTFSLKAAPKYRVGDDAIRPYSMLGLD